MNEFTNKSNIQSSTTQSLLNVLIHEYLIKNNFHQTANMFKNEANITEYAETPSKSVLYEWFRMFNEICMVRSGSTNDFENLARIEAIMLRLENEKMRYYSVTKDKGLETERMRMQPMMRRQPRYSREQEMRYNTSPHINERRPSRSEYSSNEFHRDFDDYRRMGFFGERDMRSGDARMADMRENFRGDGFREHMRDNIHNDMRDPVFRDGTRQSANYNSFDFMQDSQMGVPKNSEYVYMNYNAVPDIKLENRRQSISDSKFEDVKEPTKMCQNNLKEKNCFFFDQKINCSACTGKLLFIALNNKTIQIINLESMKIVGSFEPHEKQVVAIKVFGLHDKKSMNSDDDNPANSNHAECQNGIGMPECVLLMTDAREKEIKVFKVDEIGNVANVCTVSPRNMAVASIVTRDCIFTVDLDGEFSRFDTNGTLKERIMMEDGIKQLIYYKRNLLLVNARQKVYLYDYERKKIIRDISNISAIAIVHNNGLFALLNHDSIVIFGEDFKRLNIISMVNRMNCLAILDENNVFVGVYRQIHWHSHNSLITNEKHQGNITCLESCNLLGRTLVISMSQTGECLIWEISL